MRFHTFLHLLISATETSCNEMHSLRTVHDIVKVESFSESAFTLSNISFKFALNFTFTNEFDRVHIFVTHRQTCLMGKPNIGGELK